MAQQQRRDGRQPHQQRALQISFDGLARVDGSARFSFGPTGPSCLASVSGPIEVRLASENPSQATFEVHLRPLSNVPGTESKSLAAAVRGLLAPCLLLSRHPRTLIQLVAQVLSPMSLQEDGIVAAVINASTLALLNAGSFPMKGVVCAVTVGRRKVEGTSDIVVDPSEEEKMSAKGCFAFMFEGVLGEGLNARCVWTNWRTVVSGSFDEKELEEAKKLGRIAAIEVYKGIKESIDGTGIPLQSKFEKLLVNDEVETSGVIQDDDDDDDDDKMEI